jgi:hypothetical protein
MGHEWHPAYDLRAADCPEVVSRRSRRAISSTGETPGGGPYFLPGVRGHATPYPALKRFLRRGPVGVHSSKCLQAVRSELRSALPTPWRPAGKREPYSPSTEWGLLSPWLASGGAWICRPTPSPLPSNFRNGRSRKPLVYRPKCQGPYKGPTPAGNLPKDAGKCR